MHSATQVGAQCRAIPLPAQRPDSNCGDRRRDSPGGAREQTRPRPSPALPQRAEWEPPPRTGILATPLVPPPNTFLLTHSHRRASRVAAGAPSPTSRPRGSLGGLTLPNQTQSRHCRAGAAATAAAQTRRLRGWGWETWGIWGWWAAFSPSPLSTLGSRDLQRVGKGAEGPQGQHGCGEVAGGVVLCLPRVGHSGMSCPSPTDAYGGYAQHPQLQMRAKANSLLRLLGDSLFCKPGSG